MTDHNRWCDNPKGWIRGTCKHGSVVWLPLRCRSCVGCGVARRDATARRIEYGVLARNPGPALGEVLPVRDAAWSVLTSVSGTKTWPEMMKGFQSLIRYVRRVAWRDYHMRVEYAVTKEEGGETGMRHLNVVWIGFPFAIRGKPVGNARQGPVLKGVSWEMLSSAWRRDVGAWDVTLEPLESPEKVAAYVAKYVAKGGPLMSRKMVTYSRGWPVVPQLPPSLDVSWTPVGLMAPDALETARAKAVKVLPSGGFFTRIAGGDDCRCFGDLLSLPDSVEPVGEMSDSFG